MSNSFEYNEGYSHPWNAVVSLTNQCNCRCKYCFVDFDTKTMTLEALRATAEFLVANGAYHDKRPNLAFFGGEPLLQFEALIRPIVEEYQDRLDWSITTNGVLLTRDVVDFFVEHNVTILLSFDGMKETMDRQRPLANGGSSYDIVKQNLPYLLLKVPNIQVRGTLTHDGLPELAENIFKLNDLGIKDCFFAINEYEEYPESDFFILHDEIEKVGLKMTQELLSGRTFIRYQNMIIAAEKYRDAEWEPDHNLSLMRCGLGTTSVGITPEGKLSPCQEENSTESEIIGDVFSGIDVEIHSQFLTNYYNNRTAVKCTKGCLPYVQRMCEQIECPNRMAKNGMVKTEGACLYERAMFDTAGRIAKLFVETPIPHIRDYFQGGL